MNDSRTLLLNGKHVTFEMGATLLEVAARVDVTIPTMCHRADLESYTSCMLCLVEDDSGGRLKPACSTRAEDGMSVQTDSATVTDARRTALELLLSEHVGDCNAPCQRFCPTGMHIPKMLTEIASGDFQSAIKTVKQHIALPAVLGRICPAPCEKGCRRRDHDGPLAVCLLKRFVADRDLESQHPWQPPCAAPTGKQVAIVGSGPAGLAAAYALLQHGHAVAIFEMCDTLGGALHASIDDTVLPKDVLTREIQQIVALGASVKTGIRVGVDTSLDELRSVYDAICLAVGPVTSEAGRHFGLTMTERGIRTDADAGMTTHVGTFACGAAVRPLRMAVRAVAEGRETALAIDRYLMKPEASTPRPLFDSHIRKMRPLETAALASHVSQSERTPPTESEGGYTPEEAIAEAERCLHCECGKADDCLLRRHATTFAAVQSHGTSGERVPVERIYQQGGLVFEPGKCIKCGICVRITERDGEPLGLTYIGRGFDIRIGVPFDDCIDAGLQKVAGLCANACPTGALVCHA